MKYTVLNDEKNIVRIDMDEKIADAGTALDILMTAYYETNSSRLIINKSCLTEDFFGLRTGLAGDILQKFVNYRIKVAFVGDYSGYTSKPLKDFYMRATGGTIYFLSPQSKKRLKSWNTQNN